MEGKNLTICISVSINAVTYPPLLSQWIDWWAQGQRPCWNSRPDVSLPSDDNTINRHADTSGLGLPSKWCGSPIYESGAPRCLQEGSLFSEPSVMIAPGGNSASRQHNSKPNQRTDSISNFLNTQQGKRNHPTTSLTKYLTRFPPIHDHPPDRPRGFTGWPLPQ